MPTTFEPVAFRHPRVSRVLGKSFLSLEVMSLHAVFLFADFDSSLCHKTSFRFLSEIHVVAASLVDRLIFEGQSDPSV